MRLKGKCPASQEKKINKKSKKKIAVTGNEVSVNQLINRKCRSSLCYQIARVSHRHPAAAQRPVPQGSLYAGTEKISLTSVIRLRIRGAAVSGVSSRNPCPTLLPCPRRPPAAATVSTPCLLRVPRDDPHAPLHRLLDVVTR